MSKPSPRPTGPTSLPTGPILHLNSAIAQWPARVSAKPKPFQFTLRRMLIVVTIIAIYMAYIGTMIRNHAETQAALRQKGAADHLAIRRTGAENVLAIWNKSVEQRKAKLEESRGIISIERFDRRSLEIAESEAKAVSDYEARIKEIEAEYEASMKKLDSE